MFFYNFRGELGSENRIAPEMKYFKVALED